MSGEHAGEKEGGGVGGASGDRPPSLSATTFETLQAAETFLMPFETLFATRGGKCAAPFRTPTSLDDVDTYKGWKHLAGVAEPRKARRGGKGAGGVGGHGLEVKVYAMNGLVCSWGWGSGVRIPGR